LQHDVKPAGQQEPTHRIAPKFNDVFDAEDAIEMAAQYGINLDPWQQQIIKDWLASDKNGLFAAPTAGLSVPRQNGKNVCLLVREFFGAVILGEQIVHTAHQRRTAIEHFRDLTALFGQSVGDKFAKYPDLNKLCREIRRTTGEEAIFLHNGGAIRIGSRSKSALRGFTVDVVVLDEAQELDDAALEALAPISSSAPQGNPQKIYAGTPPSPTAQGGVFRRLRAAALSEDRPKGLTWSEWSVGGELDDIKVADEIIAASNPGLPDHPLWSMVADEQAAMTPAGFARERLGWWSPDTASLTAEYLIDQNSWDALVADTPQGIRPTAIGVDMSHNRELAIVACLLGDDGVAHLELTADVVGDPMDAADWLVERCGSRNRQLRIPVVIDHYSPAASLVEPLMARNVDVIKIPSGPVMGAACGLFFGEYQAGRLSHSSQPLLAESLLGARKRKMTGLADTGMFALDRRDPEKNIAPAVAAVLARYGASTVKKRTASPNGWRIQR
jgi:hypothetical protein